jgi:capsid protein
VNYASARMGRLAHWQSVEAVREHMLVALFCDPVWRWVMEDAQLAGEIDEVPAVRWIGQPMPLIDPPQEFAAYRLAVRSTLISLPDAQRELGNDPEEVETESAAAFERIEKLGLVSDSNPKQTNQQGALQIQPGARPAFGPPPVPSDA